MSLKVSMNIFQLRNSFLLVLMIPLVFSFVLKIQFALFSALTLHTGILTVEDESAILNFLPSHFLQITGCISHYYSSVADMQAVVYSIWLTVWYGHVLYPHPHFQLKSSWSDLQVSRQPHSSLVRVTGSLAKSLSFQYLKPSPPLKKSLHSSNLSLHLQLCWLQPPPHT